MGKPNFSEKTRLRIYYAQNGYCRTEECLNKIDDIHHRISNSVTNRKLYGNFIKSPMCGVGLCRKCHQSKAKEVFRIANQEAKIYEEFLRELKNDKIPKNNP